MTHVEPFGLSLSKLRQWNWTERRLLLLDSSMRTTQVIKGEMSAKTTYQRSAKGPVSISECSADGKYVALENTGRKVQTHSCTFTNWQFLNALCDL